MTMLKKALICLLILSPSFFYLWYVNQDTHSPQPINSSQEVHSNTESKSSYPTPDH